MGDQKKSLLKILAVVIACWVSFQVGRQMRPTHSYPMQSRDESVSNSNSNASALEDVGRTPKRLDIQPSGLIELVSHHSQLTEEGREELSAAFRARNIRRQVTSYSPRERAVYLPLFESLGLTEEQALERMKAVDKVHARERLVVDGLIALASERKKYDDEIKSILSPESYQDYLQFEQRKSSKLQAGDLIDYLAKKGVAFDGDYQGLVEGIFNAKATLSSSTHGPYDGVPSIPIGEVETSRAMQRELEHVETSSVDLLRSLDGQVSSVVLESIRSYYDDRIGYLNSHIRRISTNGNLRDFAPKP